MQFSVKSNHRITSRNTIFKISNNTSQNQQDWNTKSKLFNYVTKHAKLLALIIDFHFCQRPSQNVHWNLSRLLNLAILGYFPYLSRLLSLINPVILGYFSYQNKSKSQSKISQETTESLLAIQRSRDLWRQSLESHEELSRKAEADNECVNRNGAAPEQHTWYQWRTLFNKYAKVSVQKF